MMKTLGAVCALALISMPTLARAKGDKTKDADKAEKADKTDEKADEKADDKADDKADEKADAKEPSEADDQLAATAAGKPVGRVTLPGGVFLINAIVEANLGSGAIGKPISVAPDLWYGASDKFQLGLVHSGRGATGFLTSTTNGLCFNGNGACDSGLGKIYKSVGAEARIGLAEGDFAVALPLGIYANAFDPKIILAAKIGLLARLAAGPVGLEIAPTLFAGLTQRTASVNGMTVSVNEENVAVPVTLFIKASPTFAIAAQAGVTLVAEHAKDTYAIPVALGISWVATPKFSLDLAFGLAAVKSANSMAKAFDSRNLTLGVGYAM